MRTVELHHKLNFGEDILQRHPHDLSGGQQTRIGIARTDHRFTYSIDARAIRRTG